ncbi:MAG: DUF2183 domain-containing protein [Deltaproteobacteria bacterium]|nr:DUF2183 domain-containing protein [Deltaproteobacteria bacterium]
MSSSRRSLAWITCLLVAGSCKDPGRIFVFDGWSTGRDLHVSGRVVEDPGVAPPRSDASKLDNLRDSFATLESDEIVGAIVELEVGTTRLSATTDRDGRFEFESVLPDTLSGTVSVRVRLSEDRGHRTPEAVGLVHVFGSDRGVGVISDFDDTVAETMVTDTQAMLAKTLLENPRQRKVVEGAPAAYRAARSAGARAFFYVSGSPHSLHDRVAQFLELNSLPRGPILLKNLERDGVFVQDEYKLGRIRRIMTTLPSLRFLLVGDSGERDPEIYRAVAREFPGRVVGVFIRRAPGGDDSPERFEGMTVLDDYAADPGVLARSARRAIAELDPNDVLSPSFQADSSAEPSDRAPGWFPVRTGSVGPTQAALLTNGEASFAARVAALRAARRSVRIQALIFSGDESGLFLSQLLKDKQRAGLDVRVIVDALSNLSWQTQWMYFDLKRHGVEVEGYEALYLQALGEKIDPSDPLVANKRYHDKMWVIDGEAPEGVAIVGGLNIANEYFRVEPTPLRRWRDQDVALRGPIVSDVVAAFERNYGYLKSIKRDLPALVNPDNSWKLSSKVLKKIAGAPVPFWRRSEIEALVERSAATPSSLVFHPVAARFLQSRPRLGQGQIEQTYVRLIERARKRISIVNAYLIPSRPLIAALHAAVRRGVQVRLITNSPETNDIAQIAVLSRATYSSLLAVNRESAVEGSLEIREWIGPSRGEGTLHAKYAIFDDEDALVGSYNLDPRSATWNSETAVVLRGSELVAELVRVFEERDLSLSRAVTSEDAERFAHPDRLEEKFRLLFALPIEKWL